MKVDPRVDPVSEPPTAKDDFSVDRVQVPRHLPVAHVEEERAPVDSSVVPVDPARRVPKVTSVDPRIERIEQLLDANDWKAIATELGAISDIGTAPPTLGLVAALAHNENAKEGDPEAVVVAIRCMAGLLGVPLESPITRVLARRMLRKNPVRLRDRAAPRARVSVFIVLATLILGGGVGWLASIGSWRGVVNLLHLPW